MNLDQKALTTAASILGTPSAHLDTVSRIITAYLSSLPSTPAVTEETPAARWRQEGKEDPHGNRYDCERAKLGMGHLTDDELANAVFMADRSSLDLIAYQTAAKDRIRWLSRALEAALSSRVEAQAVPVRYLYDFVDVMTGDVTEEVSKVDRSGEPRVSNVRPLYAHLSPSPVSAPVPDVGEE